MVQIHVRVDEKDKKRLEREAREQDRSETSLVRVALRRYFKQLDQERMDREQGIHTPSFARGRATQTTGA